MLGVTDEMEPGALYLNAFAAFVVPYSVETRVTPPKPPEPPCATTTITWVTFCDVIDVTATPLNVTDVRSPLQRFEPLTVTE